MNKRKLTNQIVSFIMAFVMIVGCLANMPMMAQAVGTANEVTNVTNATEEIDYDALNEEIYGNLEDYPTGNMENEDVIIENAIEVDNVEDYYELLNGNEVMTLVDDDLETTSTSYPSEVDNSTNENAKYLPPVLSQYGGSCTNYAFVYGVSSYIINQARDKSSKITSNVLSPLFAYNILRSGASTGYGTNITAPANFMVEIGAPSAELAPISTSYTNYKYTWYPTEEIWTSATDNRVESVIKIADISHYGTPVTSADDSDLDLIKATLSSGKIIGFSSYFYTYNNTVIPSSSPSHAGEYAVDRCDYYMLSSDGTRDWGGHSMIIVGYDDNIWIDVNRDGEKQTGEFGALKIMNSHGTWYKNDGFVWVAYDAINKVSSVITDADVERVNAAIDAGTMTGSKIQNQYRVEFFGYWDAAYTFTASGADSASSGCRLVATLNTNDRQDVAIQITATNKETGNYSEYYVPIFRGYKIWSTDYALDGSQTASDGTIVIDLENVISDITPEDMEDYDWTVLVADLYTGTTPLTVKDLHFKVNGVKSWVTDLTTNSFNGSSNYYSMEKYSIPFGIAKFTSSSAPEKTTEGMEVTFTAEAQGTSDAEYQFIFYNNGETIIKDYSSDPTCVWTAVHSYYSPYIKVNVRDNTTGEVVSQTMDFTVNKAPQLSGCSITSGEMELGDSKQVLLSWVSGTGTGTLKYVVEYSYNGGAKTVYYSSTEKSNVYWTPDKAGTYKLWLSIEDENGFRDTYEATITVVKATNTATIYYYNSSYTNAYIHYSVGGGSWTSVPGVKMESSDVQDGYTWVYEIDLGDNTSATVCFNNGSGSWDSKNGANYTVGAGTYGIKNGTVTELEDEELKASLTADKSVGGTYTTTNFTVAGSNGTAPYTYKLAIVSAGTTPTDSSYFSISSTGVYGYTPYTAGDYTVYAKVIDAVGETAVTSMNYTIEGPKWNYFTATASDHKVGTAVTLEAEFVNFMADSYNSYSFVIKKDGESTTLYAGSVGEAVWTPEEAGTYTITAQFKAYTGAVYEKQMTYEVYDSNSVTVYYSNASWSQAYIHYQVGSGSWTSVPGVKMATNTNGNGYTWVYEIDLGTASKATVCFNNGNNSWDSKNGSNYVVTSGKYGIKNGSVVEIDDKLGVTVSADKAVGGTYTATNFTVKGTSGTAPYTYKLAVLVAGVTPTDSSYFTISSTGVYAYTPYTEGDYVVYAKVIDANGDTAVTSMKYSVEGPQWKSFTATASDKLVGTPVTLEAEFINYVVDQYNSYSFIVEKDGVSNTYYAGSTGYYVWTPTEEGTYTITAVFSSYTGSKFEKQMTYEVSAEKTNTVTVYYNSSWTNANIHYCVAGGSWTAVPGVTMTKTSEKSGYTHKFVIDLGDATSATICFNDGNGSWDSRNGSNYTVYAGTYGVSGGNVYNLD